MLRSGATALGVVDGAAIGRPVEERLVRRGVAGCLCFSVVSAAVRRVACTRLRLGMIVRVHHNRCLQNMPCLDTCDDTLTSQFAGGT